LRRALAASVVALLSAAPALAAEAAQPAASRYVPTMVDYLSIYDALQRYRLGLDKPDEKTLDSAFWDDGANIVVPSPGEEIRMPVKEGAPLPAHAGQPGPNAGPPPGSNAGPPGSVGSPNAPRSEGSAEVWHLPLDSYIHFESATRATHYGYFLIIYPQPEKKVEGGDQGNPPNASSYRNSIVGWPGHYEDILEKRHGEWRILQRKAMINQK
jgi:hypothetical protein